LSREVVVRRVSDHFVPVAVDRFRMEESRGADGELWRRIQRQRPAFQGIWLISPEGEVLASQSGSSDGDPEPWTREVLRAIDAGTKAFGEVRPRTETAGGRLAARGVGLQPDGGIRLALSSGLLREGRRAGPAASEALPLTAEDLQAFVPDRLEEDAEWAIPEALARKFCRALSPYSEPTIVPRPEHVRSARLTARVRSTADGRAEIVLAGSWDSEFRGGETPGIIACSATAQGLATYDAERKCLRSILLVFDGVYRHHDDAPAAMGAVVEWVIRSEKAPAVVTGGH
jgi:hypothetical protein